MLTLYRSSANEAEDVYSATPTWNADFTAYEYKNLPKKDSKGAEYSYRVEETVPTGYVMSQSGNDFINTAITSISKTKEFADGWPANT